MSFSHNECNMVGSAHEGIGAIVYGGGVAFRVWAPFAERVAVMGDFNNWSPDATQLAPEDNGYWSVDVPGAQSGQEYKYIITHQGQEFRRNDPRALQLTHSGDNSVIVDAVFDWGNDDYQLPALSQLVIYELHIGTFNRREPTVPGTFESAMEKLEHLARLGVNAIEVMPVNAVWEDKWLGYGPESLYAIEAAYGGRHKFLQFVKAAHWQGIGVIVDVVYNHFSNGNNMLWSFDGWSENGKGGIYFYNDWRSQNPWGDTRLDYGRPEVRNFITGNARMFMEDCHVDGLRVDSTIAIRKAVTAEFSEHAQDIPEGWQTLQEITAVVAKAKPHTISIAEDLQGNQWMTKTRVDGGAGFNAQWDPAFVACMREVLDPTDDAARDMEKIRYILNGGSLQRVIFTESHDADSYARLDEEIAPGNATNVYARKRSALAASLLLTAPGIPMLFQGQEFMETGAFTHWRPLDWQKVDQFAGIVTLYQHLIKLRSNAYNNSGGLLGVNTNVFTVDNERKLVAFHRWDKGGARDDVIIAANFTNDTRTDYELQFPRAGLWHVRFNSDWNGYSDDFTNALAADVPVGDDKKGKVNLGSYSVIILSQDE